jgi:multidrug efflux pump subunit AcrA (membrane-fusion protein)
MRCFITFLITAFVFSSCGLRSDSITPVKKDLIQVVYASGKIYPLNHVRIAAKVNGYIKNILVKEGDLVKGGQPLIILQAPNNDVNIDIAKTNLQLSEKFNRTDVNQLNAALQDIQSAYTKYKLDSLNYKRYEDLWKNDITAKINFDQAKTQAEVSYQSYKKAISNYDNLKTKLSSDVDVAKRQLEFQRNNKTDYIITAPSDGRIYNVAVKEGQLLTTTILAIDFGDASHFEAELDVDETDIGMVQLQQSILLSTDAYPNNPFRTVVRDILPSVVAGNKTTTVKANVVSDSLNLYYGMSVEANIIAEKKQNVLAIPVEYLAADNTVLIKKDKKKVAVKVGIRDSQFVEIISGIDEHTELIKP